MRTTQSQDAFAAYWADKVVAFNPNQRRRPDAVHPSSLLFDLQSNTKDHMTALLNRFQRHTICTTSYCLRKPKGQVGPDSIAKCRFKFPRNLSLKAYVSTDRNGSHFLYEPARNDELLNSYNPLCTIAWGANTDMTPPTSADAVLRYIAKYCSKAETKSATYHTMLKNVMSHASATHPLISITTKLLNSLLAERDWSAQEIAHLTLGLPLQDGSRTLISFDARLPSEQTVGFEVENEEVLTRKSPLERYMARNMEEWPQLTLWDMLRHFDFVKMKRRPRAAARIVNLFPLYDSIATGEQYESYCRVKLMLDHPFTRIEDLRENFQGPDGRTVRVESYQEAYALCRHNCNSHGCDPLDRVDEDALEEEEFEDQTDVEENPVERQAWEEFAERRAPNDGTRLEDADNLGGRDMDRAFAWNANAEEYEEYESPEDFMAIAKTGQLLEENTGLLLSPDTLQIEQRKTFDAVMKQ